MRTSNDCVYRFEVAQSYKLELVMGIITYLDFYCICTYIDFTFDFI